MSKQTNRRHKITVTETRRRNTNELAHTLYALRCWCGWTRYTYSGRECDKLTTNHERNPNREFI